VGTLEGRLVSVGPGVAVGIFDGEGDGAAVSVGAAVTVGRSGVGAVVTVGMTGVGLGVGGLVVPNGTQPQ
jgi:hypothetical protein